MEFLDFFWLNLFQFNHHPFFLALVRVDLKHLVRDCYQFFWGGQTCLPHNRWHLWWLVELLHYFIGFRLYMTPVYNDILHIMSSWVWNFSSISGNCVWLQFSRASSSHYFALVQAEHSLYHLTLEYLSSDEKYYILTFAQKYWKTCSDHLICNLICTLVSKT